MKKVISSISMILCISLVGCTQEVVTTNEESIEETETIETKETMENTVDGEHVITVDGTEETYSNIEVYKTGEADGDEADFYGENSAIFTTNKGTLNLANATITTNGTHANAIFSYGEGSVVNVSDSTIETSGNCSGGIMTTGGGTMNASNLTIHTTGNSSAAIRSDRGGGIVTVDGGSYVTDGKGSPVIYSTADITVNDASLTSTSSQGIVVEGKNSVTLNNVELVASNISKNSDKSDYYQAVMIYQSMSGDADEGLASFTMNGGNLTNQNGDIFFVNNTVAEIKLNNATITNESDGVFLRAMAAGWGNEGSNGGQVTLQATNQTINGDMIIDEVSNLNLYLNEASTFTGSINSNNEGGKVYVELDTDSKWVLTEDSYITSLTCAKDSIDLNGHKLYVNGEEYIEGNEMVGEKIEVTINSSNGQGMGPGKPEGGTPPDKPDGNGPQGGTPPEKPNH